MYLFLILSLPCLCSAQTILGYVDQQVKSSQLKNDNIEFKPDPHELERQEFFVKKVKEALVKFNLHNTALHVAFYQDEAEIGSLMLYPIPQFGNGPQVHVMRIKRNHLLTMDEFSLSRIAHFALSIIKNGEHSGIKKPEDVERFNESMQMVYIYKTLGEEKYKQFLLENLDSKKPKHD